MTDASRACEFYPDDGGRTIACDVASSGRMGWAHRKCFEWCGGHTCGGAVGDIYQDLQHSICKSLDSDPLWEAAAMFGWAIIINDQLAPRIEGFVHMRLSELVLEYIAEQRKSEAGTE